jgi:large subunit ribosomal protein L9
MNVVLLETIDGLGSVGQEVKGEGWLCQELPYPQRDSAFSCNPTPNLRAFQDKIQSRIKSEAKSREHAARLAEEMSAVTLKFTVKTGQEGKLFGSVTHSDVYDALKEKGFEVDKKKIIMTEAIKHIGTHDVAVRLFPEVTAQIKVEVSPEPQGE